MKPSEALAAHRNALRQLVSHYNLMRPRVFGSVLTGTDNEESDLDLLVDMPPGTPLLHIAGLQLDIDDSLGVKVNLCTERQLHPHLKARILAQARPL